MHFLSLGWALTLVRCCCSSIAWYFPGLLFRVSVAVGCLFWWQRQEIQSLFCHVFSESEECTQCAVVDQMQLLTRSLLASFDSTAITRCICSCPVAESNSCQSTSRRARASAHKTVHLPVISRGWVRFHSQPSVNQTAASLRRTAWKMRHGATFRLSDLSFLYHDFNLKEPHFPTSIIKYNLASFCKRFSSPGKLSLGSAALHYATYNPRRTLQHLYNHSCIKIHKESQCSHIQI